MKFSMYFIFALNYSFTYNIITGTCLMLIFNPSESTGPVRSEASASHKLLEAWVREL